MLKLKGNLASCNLTKWYLPLGTWCSSGSVGQPTLGQGEMGQECKEQGEQESDLEEVKERKWLPSRGTGWATRLTRAQKGFTTQGTVGVAGEGSLCQLVAIDTLLPLSSILTFVL